MSLSPGRRTAIAAGVAGGVIGAGALGAWIAVPDAVRDEAIARVERRTGLRCAIDDVAVSLGEVVLHGVELRDEGGSLEARLDEVSLDAGFFSIVTSGSDAIRAIVVRGGHVTVDASRPGLAEVVARLRGDGDEQAPVDGPDDPPARELHVEGLRATLRDGSGALASCAACGGSVVGGVAELTAQGVAIAPESAEPVEIEALRVVGSIAERRIARIEASTVLVEVGDRREGEEGAVARVRALAAALRGAQAAPEDGSPPVAPAGGPLRFASDDLVARIDGLSVRRRTAEGARDVLTAMEIEVERIGDDLLRTRGHGSPDGGGRLGWDLRVEPLALRAVGSIELDEVAVAVVEPLLPDGLPLHRPEDARIGGELRIEGRGDALHATGRVSIRDLAVASPRIAPEPIRGISIAMDGEGTFRPDQRRLEIARLRIESGAAHVDVGGAIEWAADHYLFEIVATLPPTSCSDAIGAIPRDLLQEVAGFSFEGRIGGRMEARIDSRDLDATRLVIRVADACRFEMVPAIADLARFDAPFLHRVEEPDGSTFEMETGPGTDAWTPITSISPFMLQAVIGHEDGGFFRHDGFSTYSIREALVRNLRAGRYVMGASTISMQLVKNVFLRREKTLARKVQEVLLTWWIESAWPKERILELYLNVIEYGPGIYGIRGASRHYFGVEPADLSPAQSAYLASILPNPKVYHSQYESGELGPSWTGRVARFLRLLGERGRYDAVAVEEGIRELETFRFHREGEPPPAVREFQGRTSPLPIDGREPIEAAWDEALDGHVDDGGEPEPEPVRE